MEVSPYGVKIPIAKTKADKDKGLVSDGLLVKAIVKRDDSSKGMKHVKNQALGYWVMESGEDFRHKKT